MARGSAKTKVSFCNDCRREYLLENFYKTKNPFHKNGVTLYCKDCCEEIVQYYLKQTGTLETAIWFTCSQIGVPFIRKVYDEFEKRIQTFKDKSGKEDNEYNLFANYYNCLIKNESKVDNWNDFSATDVALGDIQSLRKSEELMKAEYEKFELDWGKQTIEDYQFLEYRFDVYTEGKILTPAQETLYRQLCLVELRKRKKEAKADLANDGNELGDSTKDEQKMILDLMQKLKIDNFAEEKDKSTIELLIERQAWEHENKKPCEIVDLDYYKDMCDIKKGWGKQIKRAVINLITGSKDYPDIEKDDWKN